MSGLSMSDQSQLTANALSYSLRQLAMRAGVQGAKPFGTGFQNLGIAIEYGRPEEVQLRPPGIIVVPCGAAAWWALLERVEHSLDWLPACDVVPRGAQLPFNDPVPVLFWGETGEDRSKPFAELRSDGTVVFYADIIAATFFMLSRWEETVVSVRDEHGRFPCAAGIAYQQDFLDRPVVDEYALILREWLKAILPGWEPEQISFSIKLSHDVDHIRSFPNWQKAARTFGNDLLKRRSIRYAWQTGVEAIMQTVAPTKTAYFRGIEFLAKLSRTCGIGNDAFFFMTAEPGPPDNEYDLASALMRQCVEDLQRQSFEIGLHAGYHTFNNLERLAQEKARLDAVLGETNYGGRQHYLRFQVPDTWRHWEQVGLGYDSTMTYADHEGFRCGTCYPFQPYDIEQDRELNLLEWPLVVMDRTLRGYRGLTPEQGERRILELARRCKQVGGTFTLLWHNSSLFDRGWQPWAEMYQRVLETLAKMRE